MPPMPALSSRPLLVFGLLVAFGIGVWAVATVLIEPDATFVTERACSEDSGFSCVTLRVPRDHDDPDGGTWEVTFAIQRALSGTRDGVLVYATGGPGSSGIAVADDYASYFDPEIPERYDLVFFDQRGIGRSQPLQCVQATLDWYTTPELPTGSDADKAAFRDATERYVANCVEEAGVDPADLDLYSTAQAIEDLEVFRQWHGAEQVILFGESYGTQYVQAYAEAHPETVEGVLIDGSIDLTQSWADYYTEAAVETAEILEEILAACDEDPACHDDMGGRPAVEVYDELAAELAEAPRTFDFVRSNGTVEEREFGRNDLETAVAVGLTPSTERMFLQRTLAQAGRGELLPLARLLYAALGQDPETLKALIDPSWSDALYFAVECADYAVGSGSAEEQADAVFAAGETVGVDDLRLGSGYFLDLPCAWWPHHGPEERPGYLGDTPYPIVLLGGTWDPSTPYPNTERLAANLDNSWAITQPGGPHVIGLRGEPCPDDLITAYLLDGELPEERATECPFVGVDPYVPIPAADASDYDSALEALSAVDDEITTNVDWWYWTGEVPLALGCLHGGSITYTTTDSGTGLELEACAVSDGLALTGVGAIHDDFSMELDVETAGGNALTYARDEAGDRTATGTLDE
jgi:pimeloyl-ACP methyl ester carboxylesterase